MLRKVLDAHQGALPGDVHVTFANTGKERPETLDFVHEYGRRWDVRIRWLERDGKHDYSEVGHNSASRHGEPFAALIAEKGYLPNAVTRFCTSELKIRTMKAFALSLGWRNWFNVVGLRYDEGMRVLRAIDNNHRKKERWTTVLPLASARVTVREVTEYWAAQPFDLRLKSYEGNCDLCFLKSRKKLENLIREQPGSEPWWAEQEAVISSVTERTSPGAATFAIEYAYRDLQRWSLSQGYLPFNDANAAEYEEECGVTCAG